VSELLEEYYLNYEDARGIDEETISNLVMRAKRKLIEDGLIQKEFSTADDILELRKKLIKPCNEGQTETDRRRASKRVFYR
jgi:hypothetical protein